MVMPMSIVDSPPVPGRWLSPRCVVSSLQVKCEYPAAEPAATLRFESIIVRPTPTVAMGTIGVQMRIATGTLCLKTL